MHPTSEPMGVFPDFEIYMGQCTSDQLGSIFLDNYVSGTRTLVFDDDNFTYSGSPGEWMPITLETPYSYSNDQNLLIEIIWNPGATGSVYTWVWDAGTIRMIWQPDPLSSTGALSSITPYLTIVFTPSGALDPGTWGALKATF